MSAEHKRPLLAFAIVAIACMLILANAVRSQAVRSYLRDGAHRVAAGVELALDHPSLPQPVVAPPAAAAPFDRADPTDPADPADASSAPSATDSAVPSTPGTPSGPSGLSAPAERRSVTTTADVVLRGEAPTLVSRESEVKKKKSA